MTSTFASFAKKALAAAIVVVLACGLGAIATSSAHAATPKAPKITKVVREGSSFTVDWKKSNGATAYQIRYTTDSKMKKGFKQTKAAKKATTKKIASGVKAGTTYYAQIRAAYKKGGKTNYTAWSAKKPVYVITSGDAGLDKKVSDILAKKVKKTGLAGLEAAFDYAASTGYKAYPGNTTGDWGKWSVAAAKAIASSNSGNCFQRAALMAWLAKGLGYDARAVSGTYERKSGPAPHGWTEVLVNGEWRICDSDNQRTSIIGKAGINYFNIAGSSEYGMKYKA